MGRKALESWTNRAGETVLVHATGITVLPAGQTVATWEAGPGIADLAGVQRDLDRLGAAVAAELARVGIGPQVDAALREHPDCAALVNERTGAVATFVLPRPYWSEPTK